MAAHARVGATSLKLVIHSIWMFMFTLRAVYTEARQGPDSTGKVDLAAQNKQWVSEQCTYTVVTHTGDIENAGTDADVNVELYNKKGDVVLFVDLNSGHDNFVRGQTDTFTMVGNCVYDICKIHVSHDDAGLNPSWFVNSVSVSMDFSATVFNVYEWISKDEPPYSLSYTSSLC